MKKTFAILVALSLSLMGFAQDKQLFNHLSIGPTIGVDGIGIDVAAPVTPYVQLRAGYSIFVPTKLQATLNFGTYQVSNRTLDMTNVPVSIGVIQGGLGKILADIYPWPNIPFHFAAGLFFGSGKWAIGSVDLTKVLTPDEYATLAFGFNNGNGASISSDKNGYVNIDAIIGNVLPYIGIGFGHAVNTDQLVSVTFDMGVMIGKVHTQSYNYIRDEAGTPVELNSAALDNKDKGYLDILHKIPVYPMLKLNVFFNVF